MIYDINQEYVSKGRSHSEAIRDQRRHDFGSTSMPPTQASPHSLVVRQGFVRRGPLSGHNLHVRRLLEGEL